MNRQNGKTTSMFEDMALHLKLNKAVHFITGLQSSLRHPHTLNSLIKKLTLLGVTKEQLKNLHYTDVSTSKNYGKHDKDINNW